MRATIFFLTFVVFTATVVWRVDQVMFGDKLAWGEAQARGQMTALSHALETEVKSLKDLLLLSYSEVELGRKDFSSTRPYSHFQMMAKLLAPNLKDSHKDWQVVSTFFQENTSVKKWATPYLSLALKSIQEADVKSNSANVYTVMDPTRRPYLLLLARGGANWYVGLLNTGVFQGLMDRQKGQKSTVFVVNLQGQTLGHTTSEYVGSLLTEDPLVAELIKSSVGSGFGTFRDLKGETVQGLYEQVENSNLYAVITTPVNSLAVNRASVRWQLFLMGAGLGLIGLALFVFTDRERVGPGRAPMPPLVTPAASSPVSFSSQQVQSGADRMKAYTQVASSLSHELRSPLTSILGHAQLAAKNLDDESLKSHLVKIEEEARGAREIVQKLLIFAGEDKVSSQRMGLETAVNKALKQVEGKLISKGIKLTKQIDSAPPFTMAGDLVAKAIENLLVNAIEAMERAPKKELNVKLQVEGPDIRLQISDTGEGISSDDMPKIFDPFFTTRSGAHHVGLGLPTALGIFKEAFGEMHFDSEKGRGTRVQVTFRPQEMLVQATPQAPAVTPAVSAAVAKPVATEKVAVAAVPVKAAEEFPMVPLLVDNTIERLIEDDLPDMPPPPAEYLKQQTAKLDFEEPLDDLVIPPPPSSPTAAAFSGKIDKPQISIKKKTSRLDEVSVAVRRPGERP